MLKDRQKSVLGATVREHIRTAKPVSSHELVRHFRFKISPATVRNEMQELDDAGYLDQPYTSAGRVPTDQGYRFFVDHLTFAQTLSRADQELMNDLLRMNQEFEFLRELSRTTSRICGTFTVAKSSENETSYKSGFSELLDEPEFKDAQQVRTLSRFIDFLDEKMHELVNFETEDEHIFIGEENPFEDAHAYATISVKWHHPKGFNGFLTLVGPKRMNYRKSIALINYFKSFDDF